MDFTNNICGFINQSLSGDTLTDNLAISTYWIGRDASGLTFDASNNAVITVGLFLGGNSIGNNGACLSFATGAGGLATFAGAVTIGGNLLIGANSIGNDNAVLSFASGATGLATLTGGLLVGGSIDLNGNNLIFDADADSYMYEASDDVIQIKIGGTEKFRLSANYLDLYNAAGPTMRSVTMSATVPGFTRGNDADTGIGGAGDDVLSFIAGGVEAYRLTEATTITHTRSGLNSRYTSETLADDAEITMATGVAGWGFVQAGDNDEYAHFLFTTAGVVTLISNSANVANTDTDGNLCIYDGGSGIKIKNRLDASKTIRFGIYYSA